MVKIILVIVLLFISSYGEDAFERNCVGCHQNISASLQEMFKHYLLVYSGENNVKAGIKHYLRYPSKDISVMSKLFTNTYGIKQKSELETKELDDAINIYWQKYKVVGKLR